MFTGVIHHTGKILASETKGDTKLVIESDLAPTLKPGDSVACNGACLTVIMLSGNEFTVQLSEETLRCTAPRWEPGEVIHLEPAMKLGDKLDGHLVTGHVDGLATLTAITPQKDSHKLEFEVPASLSRFIAAKGSVTLDGISLTVNEVSGHRFSVNIIPHTWALTGFSRRAIGESLNCEIDLIARYVARLLGQAA